MSERIQAAKHLDDYKYEILVRTHSKHTEIMGAEDKSKYALSNIVKVDINNEKKCLNVYYNTGEWWHYTSKGEWY